MQWKYCVLLAVLLSGEVEAASTDLNVHDISIKQLQTHVNVLCAHAMQGRRSGTQGEILSTQYIAHQFEQAGLLPAGDNGTYFQTFPFVSGGRWVKGRNVLAKLKINDDANQVIIVGAHADHLGRDPVKGMYPGADDNASGVASVLEVAHKLSQMKANSRLKGNKNIVFAAWGGEELGILGSSYFVKNIKNHIVKQDKLVAAINLDMVGHSNNRLILQGLASSYDWRGMINTVKKKYYASIIFQRDPYLPTDSTAFYVRGIPTLNFFTGADNHYHTPFDKPETLDFMGIKMISEFLVDLVGELEHQSRVIAYNEVQKPRMNTERGIRIYLGTIPDYASSDIRGVKLSGVIKQSPALQAGIQSGDIIIKLAGKNIHDIYDYTSVLNTLRVGRWEKIVVKRGDKNLMLSIKARGR